LNEQPTFLFRKGKFANVDLMGVFLFFTDHQNLADDHKPACHVTNELARLAPTFPSNFTAVTRPLVGPGADAAFLERLDRIYPAPISNFSYNTNTYPSQSTYIPRPRRT